VKWVWNPHYDQQLLSIADRDLILNVPSAPAYFVAVNNNWTEMLNVKGVVVKQVVPCESLTYAKVTMAVSKSVPWLSAACVVTKPPKARAGVIYRVVED